MFALGIGSELVSSAQNAQNVSEWGIILGNVVNQTFVPNHTYQANQTAFFMGSGNYSAVFASDQRNVTLTRKVFDSFQFE